ncbi:MAG: hypothetical protein WC785_02730 [Tatlockia sp.]|jgi:hypothetical protein
MLKNTLFALFVASFFWGAMVFLIITPPAQLIPMITNPVNISLFTLGTLTSIVLTGVYLGLPLLGYDAAEPEPVLEGQNNEGLEEGFVLDKIKPPLAPYNALSPAEINKVTQLVSQLPNHSSALLIEQLNKKYERLEGLQKNIKSPYCPISFQDISPQEAIFLIKMYKKKEQYKIVPLSSFIFAKKQLAVLEGHKTHLYTGEPMSKPDTYKDCPTRLFWQKFDKNEPENTYELVKLNKGIRKMIEQVDALAPVASNSL